MDYKKSVYEMWKNYLKSIDKKEKQIDINQFENIDDLKNFLLN
jgi:hypothetical protein